MVRVAATVMVAVTVMVTVSEIVIVSPTGICYNYCNIVTVMILGSNSNRNDYRNSHY